MDNYVRGKLLGKGSFGSAFQATCKLDGRACVIKEVDVSRMPAAERAAAEQEAKLLMALRHPNIVQCKECFLSPPPSKLCIVMEHCSEGDLYSILRKRAQPLPEETVLDLFVQICLGLKHVHDRKILHRDLKTQNIFMSAGGLLKLGDFGVSKVLNSTAALAATAVGTPYYLSPEICQNRKYNSKSDIWSLGCVLHEMATQRHAFEAPNMRALLQKIIKGSFSPLPPSRSPELAQLVAALLTLDARRRPDINQVLALPLMRLRITRFLTQTLQQQEFSHTVIHGRPQPGKLLVAPQPGPAAPAADDRNNVQQSADAAAAAAGVQGAGRIRLSAPPAVGALAGKARPPAVPKLSAAPGLGQPPGPAARLIAAKPTPAAAARAPPLLPPAAPSAAVAARRSPSKAPSPSAGRSPLVSPRGAAAAPPAAGRLPSPRGAAAAAAPPAVKPAAAVGPAAGNAVAVAAARLRAQQAQQARQAVQREAEARKAAAATETAGQAAALRDRQQLLQQRQAAAAAAVEEVARLKAAEAAAAEAAALRLAAERRQAQARQQELLQQQQEAAERRQREAAEAAERRAAAEAAQRAAADEARAARGRAEQERRAAAAAVREEQRRQMQQQNAEFAERQRAAAANKRRAAEEQLKGAAAGGAQPAAAEVALCSPMAQQRRPRVSRPEWQPPADSDNAAAAEAARAAAVAYEQPVGGRRGAAAASDELSAAQRRQVWEEQHAAAKRNKQQLLAAQAGQGLAAFLGLEPEQQQPGVSSERQQRQSPCPDEADGCCQLSPLERRRQRLEAEQAEREACLREWQAAHWREVQRAAARNRAQVMGQLGMPAAAPQPPEQQQQQQQLAADVCEADASAEAGAKAASPQASSAEEAAGLELAQEHSSASSGMDNEFAAMVADMQELLVVADLPGPQEPRSAADGGGGGGGDEPGAADDGQEEEEEEGQQLVRAGRFVLDGAELVLPGLSPDNSDSLGLKVEALRYFLEGQLGTANFVQVYHRLESRAAEEAGDALQDEMHKLLGDDRLQFLPLVHQLIMAEEIMHANNGQLPEEQHSG